MGRIRAWTQLFFIYVICLVSLGCWESSNKQAPKAFRVGLHHSIDHLNVFTQSTTDFWKVQTYLFESLLRRDPVSGDVVANLAKSWERSDDKTKIVFELYDGLKWSDGKPLTTDDIVFTLNAHENPEFKSLYVGIFSEMLKGYKILSPQKIEFKFKTPRLSNLWDLGLNLIVYPKHIYESDEKRNRIGATSGPFQVEEFQVSKVLKLKSNPNWHGRNIESLKNLYSYDQLEFYSSSGERELFDMIKQGKIDYFQSLDPKQFHEFASSIDNDSEFQAIKAEGYRLLGMRVVTVNHRTPGLEDESVRKALMLAFDREMVINKFFYGLLQPAIGPWAPNHPLAGVSDSKYSYNVKAANVFLDQAGWKQNPKDGIREKSIKGQIQRLSFRILDFDKKNEPLLTFFKQAAKSIGVQIKIEINGFSEVMRRLKDKNFDLSFQQAQWMSFEPNLRFWYFSDNKGNPYLNVGGFKDEVLDQLILELEQSFDSQERVQLYQQAYKRIAEKLPDLFWFHDRYVFYLVNKRVKRPQDVLPFSIGLPTWSINGH